MLKCIKGEKICVSTALARKKKAETVAWCLILSWNSNVESKQKVSNFSGSTGSTAGKIAFFSRAEPDKLYIDGHLNQL